MWVFNTFGSGSFLYKMSFHPGCRTLNANPMSWPVKALECLLCDWSIIIPVGISDTFFQRLFCPDLVWSHGLWSELRGKKKTSDFLHFFFFIAAQFQGLSSVLGQVQAVPLESHALHEDPHCERNAESDEPVNQKGKINVYISSLFFMFSYYSNNYLE